MNRKQRRSQAAKNIKSPKLGPGSVTSSNTGQKTTSEQVLRDAQKLLLAGNQAEAEILYRRVLDAKPNHAVALQHLGFLKNQTGQPAEALSFFAAALVEDADNPETEFGRACALLALGHNESAVQGFEKAISLKPDYPVSYVNLSAALIRLRRLDEAIDTADRGLAVAPDNVGLLNNRGDAQQLAGQIENAIASFRSTLAVKPDHLEARNNLGVALQKAGEMEAARTQFEAVITLNPKSAQAYYNLCLAGRKPDPDHIGAMEALLAEGEKSQRDAMNLHFALGLSHDRLGAFDLAFEHFNSANELDDRGAPYDPKAHTEAIDQLISVFSGGLFAERAGMGCASETPLFIVGMPRSGTTLVEQIVASHPKMHGAGELPCMRRIMSQVSKEIGTPTAYPDCMASLDAASATALGQSYVDCLESFAPEASSALRISDKLPGNFLNLGLIALMLPRARIIYCRRNPLDNCLSCYFQFFTSNLAYSRSLSGVGHYYREHERLMRHWETVLPSQILTVDYETLVGEQEAESRRIIAFAGLEWDDECLAFHKAKRAVSTASVWQARQPIFTTSMKRWRHYERHLEPLREALGQD